MTTDASNTDSRPLSMAAELVPGDRFDRDGVEVEVLCVQEPCTDLFGRSLIRYWCKRLDTDQEGYMTYGPGGVVALVSR